MKTNKILLGVLLLTAVVQSCNLDKDPADYIDYGAAYRNMQDAKKWDNGIYSTLRGKFGGGYIMPQEAQADMLNAHAAFNNLYAEFHSWTILPESNVIQEIYHSYYAALIDANVVLTRLPELQVNEAEKPLLISRVHSIISTWRCAGERPMRPPRPTKTWALPWLSTLSRWRNLHGPPTRRPTN